MGEGASHPLLSRRRVLAVGVGLVLVASLAGTALVPRKGSASSHREAPFIATDPTADATDLYAFVGPDDPDMVTFIANYIPLEEPAGGPNFHMFGDDVRYQIKVDNDGDARPDIRYVFRFDTTTRSGDTFLYNTFPVESATDPDLNVSQTYTVTRVKNGRSAVLGRNVPVAPANVGPRSNPDYDAVTQSSVKSVGRGHSVFAGPRDDPFYVDLGSIFDLGGLRPFNEAHAIPLVAEDGVDGVGGFNTHSIAIKAPIDELTASGDMPAGTDDPDAVVGVWTTADRRSTRILRPNGRFRSEGRWVQISRLGLRS